ncbi:MAG: hypothetical protein ACYTKD_01645 [Planctomycetota bacterium]|jgi:hypothetical protein
MARACTAPRTSLLRARLCAFAFAFMAQGAALAGETTAPPEPELRRFSIGWILDARVRGALSVFAHPTIPGRVAGRAGDGVFGAKLRLAPDKMVPDRWNHQRDIAGNIPLWVTAVREGGRRTSAPGVLSALRRRESLVFWNERGGRVDEAEGAVSLAEDRTPGAAREGDACLKITAGPGPWRVSHGDPYRPVDLTGYHALSLWVRGEAPAGTSLNVHIADSPENTFPTVSPPVRIAEGGAGDGRDGWRRVAVPVARMLEGAKDFQPSQTTYVVFSGDGAATATWWIDDIRFFLSEGDLAEDVERIRKLSR